MTTRRSWNVLEQRLPSIVQILLIVGFLTLIEYVGQARLISRTTMVPFTEMVATLWQLVSEGEVLPNVFRTVIEALGSFVLAMSVGIPLGFLFWRFSGLGKVMEPYLVSMYAMPTVMFYPALLIIFGLGSTPIIIIAVVAATVPLVLNTMVGLAQMPEVYFKVARTVRASHWQTVSKVLAPAAAPFIFTGLRISATYSLTVTIGMEFILSDQGLGYAVKIFYEFFSTAEMYAYIILNVTIAVALNFFLFRGEAAMRRERV